MVTLGTRASIIGFFNFFPTPAPLFLPFPLPFPFSEGLTSAVLPISLNGLIGGAISHTWPEGIKSG